MIEGLFGSVGGILILIFIVWLALQFLNSMVKVAMIAVAFILIAHFVFGFDFGFDTLTDFVGEHTDFSTEGISFSLTGSAETAAVSRVIDGDTIVLESGDKVRLLGINSPETGQPCSSEAKEQMEVLVLGKNITMRQDEEDEDSFGRLLRYVWVDNIFVNEYMVKQGLAHSYDYGGELKYSGKFAKAQEKAIQQEKCLWEQSEHADCFSVSKFSYDAEGDDNENLNEEYVVFSSSCGSVQMDGWTLKDESASNLYTFPVFTAGEEFTLHSGSGADSETKLYWGRSQAVWNNEGDTLFLRDSDGKLVLYEEYVGDE